MEVLWIVVAGFALLTAIYITIRDGILKSYPLFVITGVAIGMFQLRKSLRKSRESK
jgi:hypothetical protein